MNKFIFLFIFWGLISCGPACPVGSHQDCQAVLAPGFVSCACFPNGDKEEFVSVDGGEEIILIPDDAGAQ